jgi:hypothetical protein
MPPTTITIPNIDGNGSKQITTLWFVLRQTRDFPASKMGGSVAVEDVSGCGTGFYNSKDAPVELIIGKIDNSDRQHLLNAMWHNIDSIQKMSTNEQIKLFNDLKKLLRRGGYEANRRNSGGYTKLNSHFKKFLKHPGNLPRRLVGVKIIKLLKEWQFLYVKTGSQLNEDGTRQIGVWKYTQPQPGGYFSLPAYLFRDYPFLYDFVRCKVETALVIDVLNRDFGMNIQQGAVSTQLAQLATARAMCGGDDKKILEYISGMNQYTLVAYPVSYHTDTFAEGEASFENKVCFYNNSLAHEGIGRGGAGNGKFVYALLD